MKKLIVVFFMVFWSGVSTAGIQLSFCEEDLTGPFGLRTRMYHKSISCQERDMYARRLQGISIFFGSISVMSACMPEPILTKVQAGIFTLSGMGASTLSFFVRGLKCDRPNGRLSWDQEERVIELVCRQLDKQFVRTRQSGVHSKCK
jgi:hypothetical protein